MSDYELELQMEAENDLKAEVVKLTAEGKRPSEIQKLTGASFKTQRDINEEFRNIAASDQWIRRRSKEIVGYGDTHYTSIITDLRKLYEDAGFNGDLKLQADIMGKIMVAEKDRIAFLSKAGILVDNATSQRIADFEHREEQIMNILKKIVASHPEIGQEIKYEIMKLQDGNG